MCVSAQGRGLVEGPLGEVRSALLWARHERCTNSLPPRPVPGPVTYRVMGISGRARADGSSRVASPRWHLPAHTRSEGKHRGVSRRTNRDASEILVCVNFFLADVFNPPMSYDSYGTCRASTDKKDVCALVAGGTTQAMAVLAARRSVSSVLCLGHGWALQEQQDFMCHVGRPFPSEHSQLSVSLVAQLALFAPHEGRGVGPCRLPRGKTADSHADDELRHTTEEQARHSDINLR